ncbi:MAG: DHA2 family efflux MFS transporter permease subunit [Deltaproteobacteria bacterium]|nr:DHA2 family efflux MFS transporter permease subunit [Deltaproteobacteria bacterium]
MGGTQITGSKLLITIAVMLAALMSVLDISIVNVALTDIRASFGTPLDQIAWVSTGYAMANVTVIPISGWFQRRFGFRAYFAGSILLFTISSALCGAAWNLPSLVVFRIIQGVGGGAIIPTAQNILFSRYPPKEHGMAGALFGLGAITGPLLGPTIGGTLIDAFSWHWIFLINVPLGLLAAALAWTSIEQPEFKPDLSPIDSPGIALLGVGMVSLQYVLEEGNRDGWLDSRLIAFLAVVAVVCLTTFIVHELETDHPVVDFRVFKDRTYAAATALNFLIGTALFAGSFLYSLFCGTILRYTALDIGLVFLRGSWIQLILMPLVGRLIGKVDMRGMIALGLAGNTLSLWMNGHLTGAAGPWEVTMPIFVRACSLSLCFVPLSVVALSSLSGQQRGSAAGLFNLTRELGGSIGLAWMSTMLSNNTKQFANDLSRYVDVYSPISMEQLINLQRSTGARTIDAQTTALTMMQGRVSLQALTRGFNEGFLVLTAFFALSLLLVLILKPAAPGAAPDPAAH